MHAGKWGWSNDDNRKDNEMSRSLNKVQLIGNVGQDPEVRTTAGGTKMAKISLATSRTFNDRAGNKQEKTEWHRITAWGKLAEIIEQYVRRGDRLFVEGRIEYSETEHEGQKRYWTDIQAHDLIMLGGAGEREAAPRQAAPARAGRSAPGPGPFDDEDEMPF